LTLADPADRDRVWSPAYAIVVKKPTIRTETTVAGNRICKDLR